MLLWKGSIYKQHKDDTEISMKDKSCAGKRKPTFKSLNGIHARVALFKEWTKT